MFSFDKYIILRAVRFGLSVIFVAQILSLEGQVLDKSWHTIARSTDSEWLAGAEAKQCAENVLLYQRDFGGWPKNTPMHMPLDDLQKQNLLTLKKDSINCTIDNDATIQEMSFLSKVYQFQPHDRYRKSFIDGLNYLLKAQYQNGGWPQFYPLRDGYYSHITYNDDAMVNVLTLFKEILEGEKYNHMNISKETKEEVKRSFDKGIKCILRTQQSQNGKLTAWCAQHDENNFAPAKARTYELPSLSGMESVGIVLLLMSIDKPSSSIKKAVEASVIWFETSKIEGYREERFHTGDGVLEKRIVSDSSARPMWARFMELSDNTPFFCDRDGIKKPSYDLIGQERRMGYAWYTSDPLKVLRIYPQWKKRIKEYEDQLANKLKSIDPFNMVVAADGSGDFTRIQDAIDNAKSFPNQRVIIRIKEGTYFGKVKIHAWNPNVSLLGENSENTVIVYDDYFDRIDRGRNSTFHTPTLLVEGNNFYAENLTIKNSAGEVGQAIALSLNADRVVIKNCRIIGYQDTLFVNGNGNRQYLQNCHIEGSTDFIFGNATAWFEECTINSKSNSFITAASTEEGQAFGMVFHKCKLTSEKDINEVYLGRPWRVHAKTAFINCQMEDHIRPEGWQDWSKPEAHDLVRYVEFNNSGPGYAPKKRVSWSLQLTDVEAKNYTQQNVFRTEVGTDETPWYLYNYAVN